MPLTTGPTRKTDNTPGALPIKAALRLAVLADVKNATVLDAFSGRGNIWKMVAVHRPEGTSLRSLRIDQRKGLGVGVLVGDNRRLLASLDLKPFDLIDLDAYGSPGEQVAILGKRGYGGPITWTSATINMSRQSKRQMELEGIPGSWIRVASSLFTNLGRLDQVTLGELASAGWTHHFYAFSQDGHRMYGASGRGDFVCDRERFDAAFGMFDSAVTRTYTEVP
jgi:hypothetical protein